MFTKKIKPIALVAINARYSHCSLGSRFLLANMGELRAGTVLHEFNLNQPVDDMLRQLIEQQPAVVGIGVYIWNRALVETLVLELPAVLPGVRVVLGGPEISYDTQSELAFNADCVIRGEAELAWPEVCRSLLSGIDVPRIVDASPPDPARIALPDSEYSADDLRNRNIYFEASRGCPYACEFCLSSEGEGVRHFPAEAVRSSLLRLMARGCRQFRFVDRSFNLGGRRAVAVLEFFLEHLQSGMRLHFEMTPDGLSPALRKVIKRFPPGVLHLETGVQSFDTAVLARVNRRCDPAEAAEGIKWLVDEAGADVHADLIAGLPGETVESFAAGFDRLYRTGAAEIQVGILKLLPGTRLCRHVEKWGMVFNSKAPYEVRETSTMPCAVIKEISRFAAHWERLVNRGHFRYAMRRLMDGAASPWMRFDAFSTALAREHGFYGISMMTAQEYIYRYLIRELSVPEPEARDLLREDYLAGGKRMHLPAFLRE